MAIASVTRARATAAWRARAGGSRSASAPGAMGVAKAKPRLTSPAEGMGSRSNEGAAGAAPTRAAGDHADGRRSGGRAPRATARRRRIQPHGQIAGSGFIVGTAGHHGHAALLAVGDDRGALGADRLGQQVQDAGQARLGRHVPGQDVQGAGQQPGLLVGDPVGRASERATAVGERWWRRDAGGGQRQASRSGVGHVSTIVAPSGGPGHPSVRAASGADGTGRDGPRRVVSPGASRRGPGGRGCVGPRP